MANNNNGKELGKMLKQRRLMVPLTLREVATMSGVSPSHLGRIERGERFPSASILQKLAKPLGFEESELFLLAGYLSPLPSSLGEEDIGYSDGELDSYVSEMLSREPVAIQHAVIGIISILKSIAKTME